MSGVVPRRLGHVAPAGDSYRPIRGERLIQWQGQRLDELDALIARAVADLDAEHRHEHYRCSSCDGRAWPCPSARVADDLRKAIEP